MGGGAFPKAAIWDYMASITGSPFGNDTQYGDFDALLPTMLQWKRYRTLAVTGQLHLRYEL